MLRSGALILTVGLLLGLTTYRQAIPSLYVGGQVAGGATDSSDRAAPDRVGDAYGKLPLSFEANHGQADARVNFLARGPGYTLLLTPGEAVFALRSSPAPAAGLGVDRARSVAEAPTSSVLRMQLLGANPRPEVAGLEQLPGVANYLMGDDPARWRTDIPTYAQVAYQDVYPGVDLVYYGAQRQLEYDFVVALGGDPAAIRLGFRGADTVEVDARGGLVLQTPDGQLRQRKPVAYQVVDGVRWEIGVRHVLLPFRAKAGADQVKEVRQVGFEVDA